MQYIHVDNLIALSQITTDGLHIPRRHTRWPSQCQTYPTSEPEPESERVMGSFSLSEFCRRNREDMRELWRTEFMPELTNTVTTRMTDIVKGLWRSTRGQSRSNRGHSPAKSHADVRNHGSRDRRSTPASEGQGLRDRHLSRFGR